MLIFFILTFVNFFYLLTNNKTSLGVGPGWSFRFRVKMRFCGLACPRFYTGGRL